MNGLSRIAIDTIEHRRGLWWYECPRPGLFHRHRWETKAFDQAGFWIYRCSCGATSYDDIPGWTKRERERRLALL